MNSELTSIPLISKTPDNLSPPILIYSRKRTHSSLLALNPVQDHKVELMIRLKQAKGRLQQLTNATYEKQELHCCYTEIAWKSSVGHLKSSSSEHPQHIVGNPKDAIPTRQVSSYESIFEAGCGSG